MEPNTDRLADPAASKTENIYRTLVSRIIAGVWPVGERIPTEFELATELSCGRHTISQAITRLAHEGMVDRRRRRGTTVLCATPTSRIRRGRALELDAFAFIHPSETTSEVSRMIRGFQAAAVLHDRRVVTLATAEGFRSDLDLVSRLPAFDIKGAVITPTFASPQDQIDFAGLVAHAPFPIVLAGTTLPGLNCPAVSPHGLHAALTATRHLLESGHRRIGFLAREGIDHTMRDMFHGYRQALGGNETLSRLEEVLLIPTIPPGTRNPQALTRTAVRSYLQAHPHLDGLICSDSALAEACLLADRRLAHPGRFEIVTLGGSPDLAESHGLTSYETDFEELGHKSFHTLAALSAGETMAIPEIFVRGSLVIRSGQHRST